MAKMKDSGIKWIGEIPAEWSINRLRYLCDMKTGGTPEDKFGINFDAEGYPWITAQDMDESYKIEKYSQFINKEAIKKCRYKLFPKNSILLVCIASVGKLGIIKEKAYSNQQITAIMANDLINSDYLLYYIQSICHKIVADASSSVVPIVNTTYLKDLICILPSKMEQELIALFINDKVNKIDDVINELNKQVEILKEYKKSLITEIVTKGLNSNVKMKNSGSDWIGNIPEHWDYKKIGYIAFVTKLAGFEFTDYFDYEAGGNVIAIRGVNLKNFKLDLSDVQTITEKVSKQLPRSQVVKDNILVSYAGSVGNIGFIESENIKLHLAPNVGKIELNHKDIYAKYVAYYLISYSGQEEIDRLKNKNAQESISMENLRRVKILIPSLEEQYEIVKYLDEKCDQIDGIIKDKQNQIDKMEKYKKSLIYEYVTGKKRVKGAEELYV